MYFKLGNGIACLFSFCCVILFSFEVHAQTKRQNKTQAPTLTKIEFSATPTNCVALRQGRKCFTKVVFNWQVTTPGDFCIQQKQDNKVIQCWKNTRGNYAALEFESEQGLTYQLVTSQQKEIIAETVVNVSWVHKATPRKRRWRIF